MGGAASDTAKDVGLGASTGGLYNLIKAVAPNVFTDIGGSKYAAGEARSAADASRTATVNLQNTLLQQPKQITPDNFLAMKSKQLANLRLGIASTITGAGESPSPVLSSPSLTGNYPGKVKLGQ